MLITITLVLPDPTCNKFDLASITDKMAEMEGDDDVPKIKLGDASCAAPFTSKLSHVSASECNITIFNL